METPNTHVRSLARPPDLLALLDRRRQERAASSGHLGVREGRPPYGTCE
jgi:hypothetical protein